MSNNEAVARELRARSAALEERTGHRAFQYLSMPTPTQTRFVCDDVELSAAGALAYMGGVEASVQAGTWDRWNCRHASGCPWGFRTEAERDAHEVTHAARRPVTRWTCEARARKGTGEGMCGRLLDRGGYCDRAADHIDER